MAWVGEMLVKGLSGSIDSNGGQAVKAAERMSEDINDVMHSLADDMSTALPTEFSVDGSLGDEIYSGTTGADKTSGFTLQLNIDKFNN